MRFLAIVGLCIVAAVLYGIVHDQVTAAVHFSILKPASNNCPSPARSMLG